MIQSGTDGARGFSSVLKASGYDVYDWDADTVPPMDAFDEFGPDVFLWNDYNYKWVRSLSKAIKSDHVYSKLIANITAADTFRFQLAQHEKKYECDVACFVDDTVDDNKFKAVVPKLIEKGLNVKIVGSKRFNINQYLGDIKDSTLCSLYASAKLSVCMTQTSPAYSILLSGGCPIDLLENNTQLPDELKLLAIANLDKIILLNKKELAKYNKVGREIVLRNHTYWHETAKIFREFDMPYEANRIMDIYNATVKL